MEELSNLNANASDEIDFETDVVINGQSFYRSPAQQLAKHITTQKYDEFRLMADYSFTGATIFMERKLQEASLFGIEKYGDKKCIGALVCNVETNKITLRKTMVDTDKHEFHKDEKRQMDDCFGVQYEIFKYLRDSDTIEIHATERKVRHKEKFIYVISKLKAVRAGRFLHFKGYGIQFFIPKAAFKCYPKGKVTTTKRSNKNAK